MSVLASILLAPDFCRTRHGAQAFAWGAKRPANHDPKSAFALACASGLHHFFS
jgi:1,6-anhydro-N-acetylmuramate kinase